MLYLYNGPRKYGGIKLQVWSRDRGHAATPISGTAQKYFIRDAKGKLLSKFGEDRSKTGLTILAVVAGWMDTGRTDGRTDGHAKVNLYSGQCYTLHWTENNVSRGLLWLCDWLRVTGISFAYPLVPLLHHEALGIAETWHEISHSSTFKNVTLPVISASSLVDHSSEAAAYAVDFQSDDVVSLPKQLRDTIQYPLCRSSLDVRHFSFQSTKLLSVFLGDELFCAVTLTRTKVYHINSSARDIGLLKKTPGVFVRQLTSISALESRPMHGLF